MNTDRIRAPTTIAGALEAIASANSSLEMCSAFAAFSSTTGMSHFMVLHLQGTDHELIAVHDNLTGSPSFNQSWIQDVVGRGLASNRMPEHVDLVELPELRHAVSAMWQGGLTTTIVLVGRETELPEDIADLMGMTSLASSYACGALISMQKASCPLPGRELECLIHATVGCSSKETGQILSLSPRTVEEYLLRCRERLGVTTTLAATATAVRRGWITFEEIDATSETFSRRYAAGRR